MPRKTKINSPLQIMFLGTGSDVGKSIIAGGFCRILSKLGYRVAPFKAQNMALNSFVTMDGKEMGRAQVFQAKAAGILPDSDMNPVLLKPSGNNSCQVIVQGKVFGNTTSTGYYRMKERILPKVFESYERLKEKYNAIVLEGAGSTTEINLKENDFVNIRMAESVRAPVVIIADIDRGGVFAALVGTMKLLTNRERRLVAGFIINKFRGDRSLFTSGVRLIEKKTGRPVFGVLPYFSDIHLPEEDSVALQSGKKGSIKENEDVRIAVIHLPLISNYTDFDPLEMEKKVSLLYARHPEDLKGCSIIIIPGTKNTIEDLLWLKKNGFAEAIRKNLKDGSTLVGICGGYQMLGTRIEDPYEIESSHNKVNGLGILKIVTVLEKEKKLNRVSATNRIDALNDLNKGQIYVEGYEIHMGRTFPDSTRPRQTGPGETRSSITRHKGWGPPLKPAFTVTQKNSVAILYDDGTVSGDGKIWGTYLHGIFENDDFRKHFLAFHGWTGSNCRPYRSFLLDQFDRLGSLIEENVDVQRIINIAERFR
ncbi:MAG TPA: cobyric acid synthase [Spirochaetes bacterium]|nr:cobyric acid synthase [Spirochaetota bacterium]